LIGHYEKTIERNEAKKAIPTYFPSLQLYTVKLSSAAEVTQYSPVSLKDIEVIGAADLSFSGNIFATLLVESTSFDSCIFPKFM
jgi:hypothetical protein